MRYFCSMKPLHLNGLVLFAVLTVFSACTSSKKFTSIRCVYDHDAQFRPGGSVPFGVVATHKNGTKISTKGYARGKYKMDNYNIQVTGGWYDGGVIFVDSVEDLQVNRTVKVVVRPLKKPGLVDSFEFQLNYEGLVTWNFSGERGAAGNSKSSRFLPVRIGGTGLLDGKDGEDGKPGTDGFDVTLYVYRVEDSTFYNRNGFNLYAVKAVAQNGGNIKVTFIAEKYGKLILKANGGDGGNGGEGGPGVDGNNEGNNTVAGTGTDGGKGGNGGKGGTSGHVKIYIDSNAREFLNLLEVQNRGGMGGLGGLGGAGGKCGINRSGSRASDGRKGANGSNGNNGTDAPKYDIFWDYIRF